MTLGTLRYVVVDRPKIPDGFDERIWPHHPLVVRLDRWFPFLGLGTHDVVRVPKFRDPDPLVDRRSGTVYLSASQATDLRRELARRNEGTYVNIIGSTSGGIFT